MYCCAARSRPTVRQTAPQLALGVSALQQQLKTEDDGEGSKKRLATVKTFKEANACLKKGRRMVPYLKFKAVIPKRLAVVTYSDAAFGPTCQDWVRRRGSSRL